MAIKIGYKWRVYKQLMGNKRLSSALPETRLWTIPTMWRMLNRHKSIILKPSAGTGGYAVIRLTFLQNGRVEVRYAGKRYVTRRKRKVNQLICALVDWGGSAYIVQQYIPLATIHGCPIDHRVMLQRKTLRSPWVITGYHSRKAGKDEKVITNVKRGKAKVLPVETTLIQAAVKESPQKVLQKMKRLSILIAKHTARSPLCKEIGVDLGVDKKGKVWIIETNPQPDVQPSIGGFRMLSTRTMFNKIIQYRGSRYPKKYKKDNRKADKLLAKIFEGFNPLNH
ncbi:YheC/YheD family protein [Mechercharimyces sp. CAU 1602]|uniref:YheC/YheD family protein n=1 Tax=Mechercharimyces sp. CAU 1602 TaxID=2973933 RepID=UPI00216292DB|nr:YheC/YheD family protein [Mechercharimyces sp. CAU 1602]MCS1350052.1 YheC/YheD family protein [Mechercharimyces sp. CAU 1602]